MHPKHPDYINEVKCKIEDAWPLHLRKSTPLVPNVMKVRNAPKETWIIYAGGGWATNAQGTIISFHTAGDAVNFALDTWPTNGVKVYRA